MWQHCLILVLLGIIHSFIYTFIHKQTRWEVSMSEMAPVPWECVIQQRQLCRNHLLGTDGQDEGPAPHKVNLAHKKS